jgi:hypothetical protein
MDFYSPSRTSHGGYWYYWTTADEIAWRNFYQVWFKLVNDYKRMGGRVTTGSDSGFIYQTYGFGYINEFELLQEAGFHPLEVIQAATMNGALTLAEGSKKPMDGSRQTRHARRLVIVDESSGELRGAVRHGRGEAERQDPAGGTRRRHQVRSKTASCTTRKSCWRTSPRWSTRRKRRTLDPLAAGGL